jgi:hypothetical protein
VIRAPHHAAPGLLTTVAFCALCATVPAMAVAAQGPATDETSEAASQKPSAAQDAPAYDPNTETTFSGTVTDIPSGGSGRLRWLMRVHTFGLGHEGPGEKQLLLTTDTDTLRVHLGPTSFLKERRVEIKKGDRVDVTGSRITVGDSEILLAREVRRGDTVWSLRDRAGQPLWSTTAPERQRFWTKTKVLLIVVGVKVALLATVLRH